MNGKKIYSAVAVLLTLVYAGVLGHAQVVETIEANPNAWTLRSIWKVTGVNSGDAVGAGIGPVSDINNDGLGDFATYSSSTGSWDLYYGAEDAPSTTPTWTFTRGAGGISHPIPAHFRSGDSLQVGFLSYRWVDSGVSTDVYFQLYIFDVVDDSLEAQPSLVWDPGATMDSAWFIYPNDFIGINMDQEVGDELVMVSGVTLRDRVRSQVGEIWFYRGGESFQVDHPTHVIVDQETNLLENDYRLFTGDLDGDRFVDMALTAGYAPDKLKLWFGRDGSPWNWTNQPDRVVNLDSSGLNRQITFAQLDGHPGLDMAATVYAGGEQEPGIYIYLSGSGKDVRTRSYGFDDAAVVLKINTSKYRVSGHRVGFLNDTTHRFEMLAVIYPGFGQFDDSEMLLLSGGKKGPNGTYDARYRPADDGVTPGKVFDHIAPLPDCNGDGWDDFLTGNDRWYGFDHGIAMVIAGGPEIPNDDTTLSVRAVETEEHEAALHIWPNPVKEDLHIAWRGDLRRMPHRFAVHDELGRLVAEGSVEPGVGAAIWRCGDFPSGMYLLMVFDKEERMIASTRFIKTE